MRFGDFQTSNRSRSLKDGISVDDNGSSRLKETALILILPFVDARENPRAKAFPRIGLRVDKLFSMVADALWEDYRARCIDSADLHSELCNQVVLRVRAETWALRNFNSAVDDRHGLGERRRAKVGKHPLERRIFVLHRDAMQHR